MSRLQFIRVPVFGPGVDEASLCDAVRNHGFVIVEEARPAMRRLVRAVEARLGIDPDLESPFLLHLSDLVDDRGWSDYLIHSDVAADYLPVGRALLIRGVRAWLAAGQPDYMLARVERPSPNDEYQDLKMPRIDLKVPFAEKDEAKAMGARWDATTRCWYVPEGMDLAPFARWKPDLRADESPASIRAARFGVAISATSCWKCAVSTPVACLVVDATHEQLEYDEDDDIVYWQPASYASALGTVTYVSERASAQAIAAAPWLRMTYSKTVGGSYLGNTCQQCGALQGDFFLHCEPGGAFFPMNEVERSNVQFQWFDIPLEANAGQIGVHTDWF